MMQVTINLNVAGSVQKMMNNARDRLALGTARAADIIRNALVLSSMVDPLHARTGTLARSWTVEPQADPLSFKAVSKMVYARILEKGGTITPKQAQMLAIPIGEGRTGAGVARYNSPRDVDNLFVFRSRAGNLIMAKKTGKDSMDLYYVLKEQVTIPAYRFATLAVASAKDQAIAEIRRAIKK